MSYLTLEDFLNEDMMNFGNDVFIEISHSGQVIKKPLHSWFNYQLHWNNKYTKETEEKGMVDRFYVPLDRNWMIPIQKGDWRMVYNLINLYNHYMKYEEHFRQELKNIAFAEGDELCDRAIKHLKKGVALNKNCGIDISKWFGKLNPPVEQIKKEYSEMPNYKEPNYESKDYDNMPFHQQTKGDIMVKVLNFFKD